MVVWTLAILLLSVAPAEQLPRLDWPLAPDKIGHLVAYGVLAFLLVAALRTNSRHTISRAGSVAFFLAAGYGLLLEMAQFAFFPGRYFEVWDIVANIIGALTAPLIYKFLFTV